ncbi:MAG: hypothetical protein WBL25_05970 [Anaerolineales bacterium]
MRFVKYHALGNDYLVIPQTELDKSKIIRICHRNYGVGWIIEPSEGKMLGLSSSQQPFLKLDIELEAADRAQKTCPRHVID